MADQRPVCRLGSGKRYSVVGEGAYYYKEGENPNPKVCTSIKNDFIPNSKSDCYSSVIGCDSYFLRVRTTWSCYPSVKEKNFSHPHRVAQDTVVAAKELKAKNGDVISDLQYQDILTGNNHQWKSQDSFQVVEWCNPYGEKEIILIKEEFLKDLSEASPSSTQSAPAAPNSPAKEGSKKK